MTKKVALECSWRVKIDFPSMVITERKAWYTNAQQQESISWIDWKRIQKTYCIMTMSNLLKTNFMSTVLPSQVVYGKWKKEKI